MLMRCFPFMCLPPQTTSYHSGGGMNGIGGSIKAQLPNSIQISQFQEQKSLSMQVCPPPPKGPRRPLVVCGACVVRKDHSYLNQVNFHEFRRKYAWVCKYAPPPRKMLLFFSDPKIFRLWVLRSSWCPQKVLRSDSSDITEIKKGVQFIVLTSPKIYKRAQILHPPP